MTDKNPKIREPAFYDGFPMIRYYLKQCTCIFLPLNEKIAFNFTEITRKERPYM